METTPRTTPYFVRSILPIAKAARVGASSYISRNHQMRYRPPNPKVQLHLVFDPDQVIYQFKSVVLPIPQDTKRALVALNSLGLTSPVRFFQLYLFRPCFAKPFA